MKLIVEEILKNALSVFKCMMSMIKKVMKYFFINKEIISLKKGLSILWTKIS